MYIKNKRYVSDSDSKTHGDMQNFNIMVQNIQNHANKHNLTYPGDV